MSSLKKEHTIEERLELSLLYDFYGALLKENQQRMFEASVLEDYNFSEIADKKFKELISMKKWIESIHRLWYNRT